LKVDERAGADKLKKLLFVIIPVGAKPIQTPAVSSSINACVRDCRPSPI
jgi:hypothetical protein